MVLGLVDDGAFVSEGWSKDLTFRRLGPLVRGGEMAGDILAALGLSYIGARVLIDAPYSFVFSFASLDLPG